MDNNEGNFYRGTGANSLRKAEDNAAAAKLDDTDDSTAGMQKVESGAERGYYRADREEQKVRKGKIRGVFKRKGVTGLLIGLIFGGMVVVGGSQAMQPFSLIAQFKETYNSMQVSAATRPMLKFQLRGINGNPKWFGDNEGNLSLMEQNSLASQNMDYDANSRTIKFEDANGATKIVDASNIDSEIATDPSFANKYTAGTKGWRGAISNWFNKITDKFISSNALTRNLFSKFRSDKSEAGGDEEAAMIKDMSKKGNADIVERANSKSWVDKEEKTVKNNKGEDERVIVYPKGDESTGNSSISQEDLKDEGNVKTKLTTTASKLSAVSRGAQILSAACTVTNIINGINLIVMAQEMLQVINLTTGVFEGIDKAKAGNGNDSPINAIGNALNQNRTNKITIPGEASGSGENISIEVGEKTTTKTAMESASVVALYSGQPVDVNDPSIQSFNITKTSAGLMNSLGFLGDYKNCLIVKGAAAGIRAVIDIVTAGQFESIASGVFEWAMGQAAQVAVGVIVGALVPVVAKMLTRDLIGNLGGEDLGNGSLATKEKYIAYQAEHEQVIAENARYERATKSPFDATSNYTFMGTLARQMMSFAGSNSLLSTLTSAGSVLSSSIMNLTPAASAYDITKNLEATNGADFETRCPYLASIGAVGDAFCNPYIITDTTTMDVDPVDVAEAVGSYPGNFDDEGNIKNGSKLAKYITFCGRRSSPFGVPDNEIASRVSSVGGNTTLNTILGSVPGINAAVDLWNAGAALNNLGYITGESCVAGNTANLDTEMGSLEGEGDTKQEFPDWEEAKWYQRFIEDQALLETMGVVEKSVVTAYLEEYDKENPVDNSYEGMLARYSGLGKDEVIAYLDFMDYCDYIAKYDPSERYAFGQDQIENPTQLIIEDDNFENNPQVILMDSIAYADVRNRQTIA